MSLLRRGITTEESSRLWDALAQRTGIDRNKCKCILFTLVYGGSITSLAVKERLTITDIVSVREAFDGHIEYLQRQETADGI
jgi:N-glycosylase/DNA lyase